MCGCERHGGRKSGPCTCPCWNHEHLRAQVRRETPDPLPPLTLEITQGRILVTRGTTQIPVEPHEVDEMCRNLKLLGDALADAL